jgi:hypothetical protein
VKKLILVLVAPVLVIAGIEGVLSLFNVAPQPPPFLPAERDGRRVYCSNQKSSFWSEPFIETCVAPEKSPGTYRVFVIGESTPNGFPFTRHCSPASWLQVRLAQLHPGKSIEVVRLASNGRHARELVDFCDEILPWHPDLLVFYCGHNEFLIFRIPEIKHPMQAALRAAVMKWRLGRSIASLIASKKDPPPDELPDTRLIADTPYLTAEEFAAGQEQYRRAVEEIHKKCEAYGTRLLVCLPACNLRDYPPTYSSFAAQTSEADRVKARALVDQATMLLARGEKASARPLLEAALEIDSTPAIAHFDLGRTLLEVDNAHALREFESARDLDMYPNRAQQPLLDILREQASRGVLVADCPAVFNGAAEYGVPGDDLFVDHCHPELSAQSLIATAILQAMAEADLVAPRSAWDLRVRARHRGVLPAAQPVVPRRGERVRGQRDRRAPQSPRLHHPPLVGGRDRRARLRLRPALRPPERHRAPRPVAGRVHPGPEGGGEEARRRGRHARLAHALLPANAAGEVSRAQGALRGHSVSGVSLRELGQIVVEELPQGFGRVAREAGGIRGQGILVEAKIAARHESSVSQTRQLLEEAVR